MAFTDDSGAMPAWYALARIWIRKNYQFSPRALFS
jgi:hypothetical protein